MPMIDVYAKVGTFADKRQLAVDLATAVMTSLFVFRRVWPALARTAPLVAVDLPGFGHSEGRADVFTPSAMGEFLLRFIAERGLDTSHLVAPDVGASAALFLAARNPDAVRSQAGPFHQAVRKAGPPGGTHPRVPCGPVPSPIPLHAPQAVARRSPALTACDPPSS